MTPQNIREWVHRSAFPELKGGVLDIKTEVRVQTPINKIPFRQTPP